MGKCKFTDEFIKNFFNKHSNTMEFIKIDKNKNKRVIIWKCKNCDTLQKSNLDGKFFERKFFVCQSCSTKLVNKSNITIEEVKEYVESVGCKIISKEYKNMKTDMEFMCKCGNIFEATYEQFKNGKHQCNNCGRELTRLASLKDKDSIIKEVENKLGDDYIILNKDEYKNMNTYLHIYHKKCNHSFKRRVIKILNGNQVDCGFCGIQATLTFESAKYKLYELVGDEYELLSLHNGVLEIRRLECGCVLHKTLSRIRIRGLKCDCQIQSKGESRVEKYLINNNIEYKKQYKFTDCKFYRELPFDFYLPQYNILIEYDGEQHYRILKHWGGLDSFIERKIRDTIKTIYCKENNIKLIRIYEYDFNNIENILNNKLK